MAKGCETLLTEGDYSLNNQFEINVIYYNGKNGVSIEKNTIHVSETVLSMSLNSQILRQVRQFNKNYSKIKIP